MSKADVDQIVNCVPEAIERILKVLQAKVQVHYKNRLKLIWHEARWSM